MTSLFHYLPQDLGYLIFPFTYIPSNAYPYDISKSTAFTTVTKGLRYLKNIPTTLVSGVINKTNGEIVNSDVYKVTDYIRCKLSPHTVYGLGFYNIYDIEPPDDNKFIIACYNINKKFIGTRSLLGDNKFAYRFDFPLDAAFIRVNTIANIEFFKIVDLTSTLQTTAAPWNLLTKYIKGKYIVTCDVSATFVLQNHLHVGTQLIIKQQNNTYINRNGLKCIFEIKNIEKRFENSQFTYILKLLEV